jgi:Zn-dependent peptidase ImmA (M78 family)
MIDQQKRADVFSDFLDFCIKSLEIEEIPSIKFTDDTGWCRDYCTFGMFIPDNKEIMVYIKNRNLADICRTLAHELVHKRQHEIGTLTAQSGETGSEIENEANEVAGVIMRSYGQKNPEIYE